MDDEFVEYVLDGDKDDAPQATTPMVPDDGVYIPSEMESMYAWGRLFVMLGTWNNPEQKLALEYHHSGGLRVQAGGQAWFLHHLPEHGGDATEALFALLARHEYSLTKLVAMLQQTMLPQTWAFGACGVVGCTLAGEHGG